MKPMHSWAVLIAATTLTVSAAAAPPSDDADAHRRGDTHEKKKPADRRSDANETKSSPNQRDDNALDEAAKKANRAVVGEEAQRQNAAKAHQGDADADSDAADKDKTPPAAEKIGHATTTAASAVINAGKDVERGVEHPGPYNPFAVEWNPLALFLSRVSFNLEYAPVTHHVVILSPHFVTTSPDIATANGTTHEQYTGFGGELGYRYYTGQRGMTGIFVGPSLLAGAYNASLIGGDQAFTNIGVAVDAGVQQVFFGHLVLGAGVGLAYLSVSHDFRDLPTRSASFASSGLKPRLLAQVGYAF